MLRKKRIFPDPRSANEDGLLCVGGDLRPEILINAYSYGIFPWPHHSVNENLWFCPQPRGVLDFKNLHISRSLKKFVKSSPFKIYWNRDFASVIANCAKQIRPSTSDDVQEMEQETQTPDLQACDGVESNLMLEKSEQISQQGDENDILSSEHEAQRNTWINPEMQKAYISLHDLGYAHSVEAYNYKDELVGGVYGVCVGPYFSAESMFYKKSNASKQCLLNLIEFLQASGVEFLDTQMLTPITESLGAHYEDREVFLQRIENAWASALDINPLIYDKSYKK